MQLELTTSRDLYLDLLKKSLTGLAHEEVYSVTPVRRRPHAVARLTRWAEKLSGEKLVTARRVDRKALEIGKTWPLVGDTMVGMARLDNLHACMEQAIRDDVPGDFIETGVWRGGATVFMRAVLKAFGITDRTVWVADSFEGFPPPDPQQQHPADASAMAQLHAHNDQLAISIERVQSTFERYGLLDDQVQFLKGWFRDSLPSISDRAWALIRLDGDLYESTMDALTNLYPSLSVGGYVIVDDYGAYRPCRQAVKDFRHEHGIVEEIHKVDWTGVYWRRER